MTGEFKLKFYGNIELEPLYMFCILEDLTELTRNDLLDYDFI